MTTPRPTEAYTVATGTSSNKDSLPHVDTRAPASTDVAPHFKIGKRWINTAADTTYTLTSISASAGTLSATWTQEGTEDGDVDTLTGDNSGVTVTPQSSNIDLLGTTGQIETTGDDGAGSITWSLADAVVLVTSLETPEIVAGNAGSMAITMGDNAGADAINFNDSDDTTQASIDSNGGAIFNALTADGTVELNDSNNANTSINTGTSTGTVTVGNSAAGAIVVDTGAGVAVTADTASSFTVTDAAADLTLESTLGRVIVNAGEDAADAIYLHANAGTSETIRLHSDQGTGAASVHLESDVGGVTLTSGLASADAVNVNATAGGVDIDGALEINITSSEAAVADAVTISASAADGGVTIDSGVTPGVTFTNGTQSHQMLVGSGSPNGAVTASQGSMYVDVAGSTSTTILFVNTDGTTTWVGVGA